MKLIIDIPEDVYTRLFDNGIQDNEIATDDICEMARALRLGTPLPKGHGRLIDADELANDDRVCNGISCSECPFENFREHSCRWCDFIKDYHAIIKADTESGEQEKIDDYRDILDELEREEYYESKYGKEQE